MITALKKILNENTILLFSFFHSLGILKITSPFFYRHYLRKRANLKLTDIDELAVQIPLLAFMLTTPELNKSNDWYGHAACLKKYCGYNGNYATKAVIEHGANILPSPIEDIKNEFRSLIIFGRNYHNYLKDIDRQIYTIGPFIHYAAHILSPTQLASEKKRLKRSLLVFPSHATSVTDAKYDTKAFCNKILSLKERFDSIRICLYWKDINNGLYQIYKDFGFECVTAGHIFDPLFLSRLKSIIEMSTVTMSNNIGTHLGYCIYMNKPHYFFRQKLNFIGKVAEEIKIIETTEKSDVYMKLRKAFGTYSETISKQQYDLVNFYWGLDQTKTRGELRNIFNEAERLYKK